MTPAAPPAAPPVAPTVALFATCMNDAMFPATAIAATKVLARLGCVVEFPREQTCCGQMFTNTGYASEALGSVRTFVSAFADYDYVVGPSGSCIGSVRDQHPMLAEHSGDPGLAREVAALTPRVYDLSEFIVNVLGREDVGAYFPHRVTYHSTCHSLRVAKVGDAPVRLLKAVRSLTYLELPNATECCGFGGTFSMKNPDVSVAMASDKARHVRETGAEVLVAGDNSCLLNVGGILNRQRAGIRIMHLAEVLASTQEEPA